jgi:hypothetical protein
MTNDISSVDLSAKRSSGKESFHSPEIRTKPKVFISDISQTVGKLTEFRTSCKTLARSLILCELIEPYP